MIKFRAALLGILACATIMITANADAADKVKVSAFQGTFINFPIYVAKDLKLFDKFGIDAELVYGKGIQPTNMVLSGATDFGGFAVEHGAMLVGKGQDIRLLVLNQTLPPFSILVRNGVPTPNGSAPYPKMLGDLKGLKIGISTPGAGTDLTIRFLLQQAGLDSQNDVKLVPVGEPSTQIAALKNGIIDATIAFEPIQTEAVHGQKIARSILDIQGGHGPDTFAEYAYNGIFTRQDFLKSKPDVARRFVKAIVEAERMIADPAQIDTVTRVAAQNMGGIDPKHLKMYISNYRHIFAPVATRKAIENVNAFLLAEQKINAPVPYEALVATDFMPESLDAQ